MKTERISEDEYFTRMAILSSERSTCRRLKCGAVIVVGGVVVSTAYNGAPRGLPHCGDWDECVTDAEAVSRGERPKVCWAAHAEANAIVQAGRNGAPVIGGTLYVTGLPCSFCSKLIINSGIVEIVMGSTSPYEDRMSRAMLKGAEIKIRKYALPTLRSPVSRHIRERSARNSRISSMSSR